MPDEDNDEYEDTLDQAAGDMVDSGKSLDDAAEEFDVDRDELSDRFGEKMKERYGEDADDENEE